MTTPPSTPSSSPSSLATGSATATREPTMVTLTSNLMGQSNAFYLHDEELTKKRREPKVDDTQITAQFSQKRNNYKGKGGKGCHGGSNPSNTSDQGYSRYEFGKYLLSHILAIFIFFRCASKYFSLDNSLEPPSDLVNSSPHRHKSSHQSSPRSPPIYKVTSTPSCSLDASDVSPNQVSNPSISISPPPLLPNPHPQPSCMVTRA
ncbi:hypothetical protein QYF36_018232 [Acer negundo]|nr:hypothetical protein QYF36_018232 [Acer negundo]